MGVTSAAALEECDDSDLDAWPERRPSATATTETGRSDNSTQAKDDNCHPAYEPCLPNLPGDAINCGDLTVEQKPVTVKEIGVDPYRLDRDGDGRGCTN